MAQIFDEAACVLELDRYANLDALGDGAFDDITALVASFFQVPVAIVSLMDGDRVWFKSAHGLGDLRRAGTDLAMWASAIIADEASVGTASRVTAERGAGRTNPPVANDNGSRFYAAAPLRSLHGYRLGTLCIIDTAPRPFSREDEQMLARFGRLVMVQMEQRLASRVIADLIQEVGPKQAVLSHTATHDVRTGLLNRGAIQSQLQALCDRADDGRQVATLLFDVDHLQTVNDMYGQSGGDAVLAEVADRIQAAVRPGDYVGRFGGEEFLVILVDCDRRAAKSIAERMRHAVEWTPIRYRDKDICITVSAGVYLASGKGGTEIALKAADDALYAAKREGRNRVVFSRPHAEAVTADA